MSNIMQFLQNIKSQNGFKAKLRNRLFSSMIHGFEAIEARHRLDKFSAGRDNEKTRKLAVTF